MLNTQTYLSIKNDFAQAHQQILNDSILLFEIILLNSSAYFSFSFFSFAVVFLFFFIFLYSSRWIALSLDYNLCYFLVRILVNIDAHCLNIQAVLWIENYAINTLIYVTNYKMLNVLCGLSETVVLAVFDWWKMHTPTCF